MLSFSRDILPAVWHFNTCNVTRASCDNGHAATQNDVLKENHNCIK